MADVRADPVSGPEPNTVVTTEPPASVPGRLRDAPLELVLLPAAVLLLGAILTGLPKLLQADPREYFTAASGVLQGQLPYRDITSEYPPFAFVVWLLPRLLSGNDYGRFTYLLGAENLAFLLIITLAVRTLVAEGWATSRLTRSLATLALMVVGVASVAAWRFDLSAAALMAVGLVLTARGRHGLAGVLLGLATLTKLFPAVVVLVLLVALASERRWRAGASLLVGFAAITGLVMLAVLLVAGGAGLSFLAYQQARGLQVESVGAGIVLALHALVQLPTNLMHAFGSTDVGSPLSAAIVAIQPILLGLLLLALLATAAYRFRWERRHLGGVDPGSIVALATCALLLTLVANKVFSPQYLVWLLPVVPLLPRRPALLAVAAGLLTVPIYPGLYTQLLHERVGLVALLNLRNLILIILLAWLWIGQLRPIRPPGASTSAIPEAAPS